MASGRLDAGKISKEKSKWGEGNKVYTRRLKGTNEALIDTVTASSPPTTAIITDASPPTTATDAPASPPTTSNNEQTVPTEDANFQKQKALSLVVEASDDSSSQNRRSEVVTAALNEPAGNGVGKPAVDERVKINFKAVTSKNETNVLSEKLKAELDQVRGLVQKLEDRKAELTSYSTVISAAADGDAFSHSLYSGNNLMDKRALLRVDSEMGTNHMDRRALARVNSETGSDIRDRRALMRVVSDVGLVGNQDMRPISQPSIAVDNSHGVGGFVEKEKRTPKANQYYRSSEFLLGKDRLPPESNKRPKASGRRKQSGELEYGVGPEKHRTKVFKSCSNLLQRLMKHKHGWVFNDPVNAKMLGLHDYHDVIKHPMDLGTIKSRLAQNFYKSPKEFAEDIRLTFHNAMAYNPAGHDVHVMAEQLSNIFEERWPVIESQYNLDWRYGMVYDAGTPTPTSRELSHFTHVPLRTMGRSEPMTLPFMSKQRPSSFSTVSRTAVLKITKANDPNKRNMTSEEKQKLSIKLQSLPPEKLDHIVQIIKKKTSSLCQHDDELEVNIDSVDVETLWELDRFVTNYKKSLSKRKRKTEIAQQARAEAGNANQAVVEQNPKSVQETSKENKADEKSLAASLPDQGDWRGGNISRPSSSSSSSSDSGSSSSDSDSDSSSVDGSEAGHSPRS